jgi:DNA-binding response OmpR family regulator
MSNKRVIGIDSYRHLEKCSPFAIKISMDELADEIVNTNQYGVHRLLSSLVHSLRKNINEQNKRYNCKEISELADGIEELLNKGYYK